ncbi:Phosphoribosyl 1,2-cyclic phosphodiesterase [Labrenzia sp. THAF82]|uniref:MBL fold metallo-hydrolase n=1 Tax=Labrenzia sp. THAF82 TaxID=2587861 RepID=UPI001267E552|nr:MBL fold metallo-hydrolase [Labrenzia sp. THAF82]QFT32099.1 Phosphoribosyl 1,2-cyclic phosphodiesterase [Labrenzia sp. THAF82]
MTVTATILGCGSSGGVPRIGNDWGDCDPGEPRNRRLRCAILVEKRVDNKCTTVLIDTGPDLRHQLLAANVQNVDAVLYTHAHADHVHGIDDLRGFWVKSGKKTNVYMDLETYGRVHSAFSYCFETPKGSNYPPILEHQPIQIGKPIEVSGAGGTISFEPIEVVHGEINALGFKTSGLAYVPDVSDIPEKSEKALKDLNILVLDCLRRRPHPSHFCLQDSLEWTKRLAPKKAVFTNLHNDLDYRTLCDELPAGIEPAYDGLQLVLDDAHDEFALSNYAG